MKVCFVALTAARYLSGSKRRESGGAEIRLVHLARELAGLGAEVSFVVHDDGDTGGASEEFELHRSFDPAKGLPLLRHYTYRRPLLESAMREADADVYCQLGAGMLTGIVGDYCRKAGRRFVFFASSDSNFDTEHWGRFFTIPVRDKAMYKSGIRKTDLIVVQHESQRAKLREEFGLEGTVVPSGLPVPDEFVSCVKESGPILWIGRFHPVKMVERFLALAEAIPDRQFLLVGGSGGDTKYVNEMRERASGIPNLEFAGHVDDVSPYIEEAGLLVNTSKQEGFPMTFLQAWLKGVPVLTAGVDPGGALTREATGIVADSEKKLKEECERLMSDYELRKKMGARGYDYVVENHDVRRVGARVYKLMEGILSKSEPI